MDYRIIAITIAVELILFGIGVMLEWRYDREMINFD